MPGARGMWPTAQRWILARLFALPPDVDVRVMPYLACLRCHVHRQVHAFVIGAPERLGDLIARAGPPVEFAEAPLDFVVGQRFRECHPLLIGLFLMRCRPVPCHLERGHDVANGAGI